MLGLRRRLGCLAEGREVAMVAGGRLGTGEPKEAAATAPEGKLVARAVAVALAAWMEIPVAADLMGLVEVVAREVEFRLDRGK